MATINDVKRAQASESTQAIYDEILSHYTAYELAEPHEIYRLMGHTPEFLSASWPRSRHLYAGQSNNENLSISLLTLQEKHLLTLAISAANNCEYCVRIHTQRLSQLGLSSDAIVEGLTVAATAGALNRLAEGMRIGDRPTIATSAGKGGHPGQNSFADDAVLQTLDEYSAVASAFRNLASSAFNTEGALGIRVKVMIGFAIASVDGSNNYVKYYHEKLKSLGLSEDEMIELLLVIDLTCGYNRYVQGLQITPAANT